MQVKSPEEVLSFCCQGCLVSFYNKRTGTPTGEMREKGLVEKLEGERKTRLITMIHRSKMRGKSEFITIEDAENVLDQIRNTPSNRDIDLLLHTPGGLILPAEQIAMALSDHEAKVTVIIPHYAMSGGTLIALAADEILMDVHSVLGPLDPQVEGISAPTLLNVVRKKGIQYVGDDIFIASEVARKALVQMSRFIQLLLKPKMTAIQAKKAADFLTGGYLNHDSPITVQQARKLGLSVKTGIPQTVYELLRLYRFSKSQRPSLFSIPCPCLSRKG